MLVIIYILSAVVIYELSSITIFSVLEGINNKKIHKYVADEGYKIDLKKWTNQLDFAIDYTKPYKESILSYFKQIIPIYNLIFEFKKTKNYNKGKEVIIQQLKNLNVLLPMSIEEIEEYRKNPTGYNARTIAENSEEKEKNKELSIGYHDNGLNIIYFQEKDGEHIITKTEGSVSKLSKKEQYKILREYLHNLSLEANNQTTDDQKLVRERKDSF